MDVFYLSSTKKIIKSYELDAQNNVISHPYPHIYNVTSYATAPKDLSIMYQDMIGHALRGDCLLKGILHRPLVKESRSGSTDANTKTEWVCLDLDGVAAMSPDVFLAEIGCAGIDYILQWSSSMGIEGKPGLRCHIFMQLDKPVHPLVLKHWLMSLNLKTTSLSTQLELTKTGNALRWPLDITTCQNDKLIYIAPPRIGKGISDPFPKNRITFELRTKRLLTIPYPVPDKEALQQLADVRINELRVLSGLPKRKATKYKYNGTVEYMVNPSSAVITEIKTEREFVYFNLNGGDSWAYYHPEDNPTFIHNFKGEPIYRTEDLLPDYWAELQQKAASYAPDSQGRIFLAFRDFKTSNYFNGYYDTINHKLELSMAKSESQLRQFMKQHGQVLGDCITDWDIVWDPESAQIVDTQKHELNTYQPSTYLQNTNPPVVKTVPPTIEKIITHTLGYDAATIDHFLNWVACIVQYRTATGTAWVWHGIQGTGKGVLFHKILSPIFGSQNVVSKRMEEIESEFTEFMENKFVIFIDEVENGRSVYHSKISAKLKTLIVEPTISIRRMYTTAYAAKNYANMIFASNETAPVEVAPDDRRFNVGPFQTTQIDLTPHEIDVLIPSELEAFYAYLSHYPADRERARKPLVSAARSKLIEINRTAIDTVADALLNGDLQFFWDHLSTSKRAQGLNPLQMFKYTPYRDLVVEMVTTLPTKLTRDELYTIAEWCIGNMPQSPHKFTALLKHHQLHTIQVWKDGRNVRGIEVVWKYDPVWLAQAQAEIISGVV